MNARVLRLSFLGVVLAVAAAAAGTSAPAAPPARGLATAAPGDRLWTRIAPATATRDDIKSVVAAPNGGVYAVGYEGAGKGQYLLVVSRRSSSGRLVWLRTYGGPTPGTRYAFGSAAAVDRKGNLIVGGSTSRRGHGQDYLIVKYSAAGRRLWLRVYDGPAHRGDLLAGVATDASGNVYAAGTTDVKGGSNYLLVKLRTGDGRPLWRYRYSGPLRTDDCAAVAVTPQGVAFLTGVSDYSDPVGPTTRLASATVEVSRTGHKVWSARETASESDAYASDVVAAPAGGCYTCGYYAGDAMVVAYSSAGAANRQTLDFNGHVDQVDAMALDPSGNVVICGSAMGPDYQNLMVAKLLMPSGLLSWPAQFGGGTTTGEFMDVACDASGAVYATGMIDNGAQSDDICTVKYGASGGIDWANVYSGPHGNWDWGRTICVTPASVYVGGFVRKTTNNDDGIVIRYQP